MAEKEKIGEALEVVYESRYLQEKCLKSLVRMMRW